MSNGGDASNYLKPLAEMTIAEAEIETIRKDLLAYCKYFNFNCNLLNKEFTN